MLKLYVQEYLNYIGQTQYWLAKQTDMSANAICRICNGETTNIRIATLSKICEALNCTPNDILQDDKIGFIEPDTAIATVMPFDPKRVTYRKKNSSTKEKQQRLKTLEDVLTESGEASLRSFVEDIVNTAIKNQLSKQKSDGTK